MQDEEILKRLEGLFSIRARLVARYSGDKGRFELTDREDREVDIDSVSPLRIIAVLRKHGYPEAFEEINAFDGELVFSKPAVRPAKTSKCHGRHKVALDRRHIIALCGKVYHEPRLPLLVRTVSGHSLMGRNRAPLPAT